MPRKANTPPHPPKQAKPEFNGFVRIEMTVEEFDRFDAAVQNREYDFNKLLQRGLPAKLTITPRPDGTWNACYFPTDAWANGKGVSAFSDSCYEAVALVTWKLQMWLQDPTLGGTDEAPRKRRG